MSDVPKNAEELGKTLHDLREAVKAGHIAAEKVDKLEQGMGDLKAALRGVEQARHAEARAASERLDGSDSVLKEYVISEAELKSDYRDERQNKFAAGSEKAVRLYTAKTADGAIEPGLLDDPSPRHAWQKDAQEALDRRNFVRLMQRAAGRAPHTPTLDRRVTRAMQRAPGVIGKIFSDSSAIGAEWIADQYFPQLERELELMARMAGLFRTIPLTSGDTLRMPFLSTGLRPYLKGAAPSADDPARYQSSTLTTAERTKTVKGMAVRAQVDEDSAEDAYIPVMDIMRAELLRALVDGQDDVIINGDTASTHQDDIANWNLRSRWGASGLGTALDHRRHSIGLRARAADVSNTTDGNAAQTAAGLRTARSKLASAHAMGNVKHVTSPEFFLIKLLADTAVQTWDKVGPNASILTGLIGPGAGPSPGSVGFVDGVEIIVNWFVGADLNASGVYDNSTTDNTSVITVNTDRFFRLVRRGARFASAADITRGVVDSVVTERWLFDTIDGASVKNVHDYYNLDGA